MTPSSSSSKPSGGWQDLFVTMRPAQWTKNALVLAALVFAWGDRARPDHVTSAVTIGTALLAAIVFCMLSSAVYIFNDLFDLEADRAHPRKRCRPIRLGPEPRRRT